MHRRRSGDRGRFRGRVTETVLNWTQRILAFPVRTAAVDTFLSELKTKRSADLNSVLVTLNEGGLCRQALGYWVSNGWIVVAPHSPLVAMAGPAFAPDLTLCRFCGEPAEREEDDRVAIPEHHSDDSRQTVKEEDAWR